MNLADTVPKRGVSIDVASSADLIVRRLLAVKPREQVALVCDPQSEMSMVCAIGLTEPQHPPRITSAIRATWILKNVFNIQS